jgi:hypothetical protein
MTDATFSKGPAGTFDRLGADIQDNVEVDIVQDNHLSSPSHFRNATFRDAYHI